MGKLKKSQCFSLSAASLILVFMLLYSCGKSHTDHSPGSGDTDTLKVVTLYGPTSYFDYREEPMGIDYENVRRFAEDEGLVLQVHTVNNIRELIEHLESGKAHLAAYPVPSISEYNSKVIHCGSKEITRQVLVQRKGADMIEDVTQLIGKDVYVEENSKYHFRLLNLDEELGGGIGIKPLKSDTIVSEDFLQMVSRGDIDYAVVDSNIASLYQPAFPNLDVSLPLSADQAASWAVAPGLDSLAVKIDRWENKSHSSEFVREIYKRYYDRALREDFDTNLSYFKKLNLSKGKPVSNYDDIFRRYASVSGYDWRLLAAIAYCESRYNPTVESRFGAYGLMQMMPSTARALGVEPSQLGNPDLNVKAAAKLLSKLDSSLKGKVEDPKERMKLVVAAYNSGLGHIYDSIALAQKYGLDAGKWTGNVSVSALMKARPEYYNDPVVKNGYFRGRETVDFVDHVMSIYDYLMRF